MKTYQSILIMIMMMSVMASCEKFGSDVEAPSVQVTVSPENPKVGDEVTITISTDAQLSLIHI